MQETEMGTTQISADDLIVELSSRRPGKVWQFFYNVQDVSNLSPAEEQQTAWEARIPSLATDEMPGTPDGVVGMGVVDTFPSTAFVSRIAVIPEARERGVGSALLTALQENYGELACRVRTDNETGQALVEANGFTQVESRFHDLYRYETQPD